MYGDPYQLFLGSKKCQLFRADLAQPQHAFTMHAMLPSAVDRPRLRQTPNADMRGKFQTHRIGKAGQVNISYLFG
jgi:hypothetical protein